MKHMTLQNITSACRGTYHGSTSLLTKEVAGIEIDSRKIAADYLFIPIKGAKVDGHDFIPQVMKAGALCTLSEHELPDADFPYILVDSCEQAMKDLAEFYRDSLDIKVVGITGSVGKTSTKEMIASVLEQKYKVWKTAGNFNNEIGLPLTIFGIREEHEIAVLEMGINHFGEMHRLAKMAKPDICVITNIGWCHLEALGDRDGILKAKTEVFDHLQPEATVILNGDDDKLSTVREVQGRSPLFFGCSDTMTCYADPVQNLGLKGTSLTIHLPGKVLNATVHIPGSHMVYNALAGALVGHTLGLTADEIAAGIEKLVPVSGRNNMVETDTFTIIDDCYNANPVSMKASLDVLSYALGRTVAILGDMGELGETEKELHREVGIYAGERNLSLICCVGPLSESMAEGARSTAKGSTILHFPDKQELLFALPSLLKKGDTILIKASHYMEFPEIVSQLKDMHL